MGQESKIGAIGCPETSVRNYHHSLRNNPEERISQLLRGGSLKSRTSMWVIFLCYYSSVSIFVKLDIRDFDLLCFSVLKKKL